MSKALSVIERTKRLLNDDSFIADHRCNPVFFTRNRTLTFCILIILMLRKSLKSVQLVLNEFFDRMNTGLITVTSSAFTQARSKMLHTAFIELNRESVIQTVLGVTQLNFNILIFIDANVALHKSLYVKSSS